MLKTLEIDVIENQLPLFFPLLEKGILLEVKVGCSVKELLCGQLDLAESYLEQRVQTLFHNGKAVDDFQTMIVQDQAVLALSAAMPGLVGATLRKSGAYAAFRQEISAKEKNACATCKSGWVTLKLFNMIRSEFGPQLFSSGVWVETGDLRALLSNVRSDLEKSEAAAHYGDQPIAWNDFGPQLLENEKIFMKIHLHQA
jgi:hypothetical protein